MPFGHASAWTPEGEDVNDLIKRVDDFENSKISVDKLGRMNSVLIATAHLIETSSKFDLSSVNLDLPQVVKANLNTMLPTYLKAIKLDGYSKEKKRKAFIIGNTGTCSVSLDHD